MTDEDKKEIRRLYFKGTNGSVWSIERIRHKYKGKYTYQEIRSVCFGAIE